LLTYPKPRKNKYAFLVLKKQGKEKRSLTKKRSVKKKMEKTKETENSIKIQSINRKGLKIKIESVEGSTYIPHRLTDEAVDKFMGREVGETKKKKIRDFDNEYQSCFYYTENKKYGIPASAFMSAILNAAVACNIPKTQIKRAIRVLGDILPLSFKEVKKRVDHPRRSGMTSAPDTRVRPEFVEWSTDLIVQYDANQISPDQIINLVNQAGFSSGVGDWRPSAPKSSGTHGMFKVFQDVKHQGVE